MEIKEKIPIMTYSQYRRARKLLHQKEQKRCAVCGQPFLPGSNRAKHCKACAAIVHRWQKTLSDRKRRAACGQLEAKKP